MSQEEWLTTEEVAKELKVNVKTVRKWISSGELEASQMGKGYRISRHDLLAFAEKRKKKPGAPSSTDTSE
jgi:excisionase family DNA binding protein